MFSKILIKLIDQAIVPAILLLSTRIISLVLISNYLDINFTIGAMGIIFENESSYIMVNSYSMVAMMVIINLGLFFVLIKSFLFHDTHITPKLTAKLFALKIPDFIQNSLEIYSQGAIWISYSYLITLVAGVMSYFGLIYIWVFAINLVFTIISTLLLIIDIEREINFNYKSDFDLDLNLDKDEKYLEDKNA